MRAYRVTVGKTVKRELVVHADNEAEARNIVTGDDPAMMDKGERIIGIDTEPQIDPLAMWDGTNHRKLVRLLVQSAVENVNGSHSVSYKTELHDLGGGVTEADYLIMVTFFNDCGPTCVIDGAFEEADGQDWRMFADELTVRLLTNAGANSKKIEWPTPDVRVTHDWSEDENDITKTVDVVWNCGKEVWDILTKGGGK